MSLTKEQQDAILKRAEEILVGYKKPDPAAPKPLTPHTLYLEPLRDRLMINDEATKNKLFRQGLRYKEHHVEGKVFWEMWAPADQAELDAYRAALKR